MTSTRLPPILACSAAARTPRGIIREPGTHGKPSAEEKAARAAAIEKATKYAAEVPLKVMETASKSYELLAEMAGKGNPASVSDVGVGALATRACVEGAALNVRINLAQLKDEKFKASLTQRIRNISADYDGQFEKITQAVEGQLGKS